MGLTTKHLPRPHADQAYMEVSALEAGSLTFPMNVFVAGEPASDRRLTPSLSFLLRHSKGLCAPGIVFDMGLRKRLDTLSPSDRKHATTNFMPIVNDQDVADSLNLGGTDPAEVQIVILSHLHWDHMGDSSQFPKATFIAGPGAETLISPGWPEDPGSRFLTNVIPRERSIFLPADKFTESVGPFPRAYDYFGDGSMYVVDAAGHLPGHINLLARTSADGGWIFLAGDSFLDRRILEGEKEMPIWVDEHSKTRSSHVDTAKGIEHMERIRALMCDERARVMSSHEREWYHANKGGDAFWPGRIPSL